MRISDWSSDVCSSDLRDREGDPLERAPIVGTGRAVDHYWLADVDTNAARRRPQAFHIAEEPGQRFGLLAPPGLLGGIFLDVAGHHGVDGGDAEAVLSAHRLQQTGVAGPLVAEAEEIGRAHV